jgi:hypothetical protein
LKWRAILDETGHDWEEMISLWSDRSEGGRSICATEICRVFCCYRHTEGIKLPVQMAWWRFASKLQPLKGHTLETILNYLEPRAKEIKDSLTHFMLNHSSIEPRKPYDEVWYIDPEGDRYYGDLDKVGMKMQSYLSECYGQFYSMIHPLLEDQPEDVLSKISKSKEIITRTIDHRLTFCDNTKHALHLALAALEDQLKILKDISEEKKS